LLREAGIEQLGPYVSQVARETKGRNATFLGEYDKYDPEYRDQVRDFLSGLGIVFSPARYRGMVLWLDGNSFIGECEGTAVTEWQDVSGQDYNAVQSVENRQPIVVYPFNDTEGEKDLSRPAVRFDGSDNLVLVDEAKSIASDVSGITMFVVRKAERTSGSSMVYTSISTNIANVNQRASSLMSDGKYFALAGRRLDDDAYTVLRSNKEGTLNWHIHTNVINYEEANGSIYVDGTHLLTNDFLTEGNTSNTDSLRSTIGSQSNDAFFFSGDIAEVIIYNRALSDAERSAVDSYLQGKYGF